MAKISSLQLRTYPGNSIISVGDVEISRTTTISDDTLLRQEFGLTCAGNELRSHVMSWVFDPGGSSDQHLKVMDRHWRAMRKDLEEVVAHAEFYHKVKAKNTEGSGNPLLADYMEEISPDLFHQKIPDADFAKGKNRPRYYPITSASQRGQAIRNVASQAEGIELDPYEMRLMALDQTIEELGNKYADGMYGKMDVDEGDDGLQLTGGSEGEDHDWREGKADGGHEEGHEDESPEAYDGEEEDDDDEQEKWRGEVHNEKADDFAAGDDDDRSKPWFTEDRDSAEDKMDRAMESFEKHMLAYSDAANEVWMSAVEQIYQNQQVSREAYEPHLKKMQAAMKDASGAYEDLKALAVEDGKTFELTEYFDRVEDPQAGPFVHMEWLTKHAEKPAWLGELVKKCMNKQRHVGDGPSPA